MSESRLIRDMPIERRDDLIAQVWAFLTDRGYTITAPGTISLETRLADMTREARLSREATEKAVASRIARHEIERALRAVNTYDDVASDEDVIFHDGAMHAVRIIRDMLGLVEDTCWAPGYNGTHVAVGAGAVGSPPYVCHGCGGTFTPKDNANA